MISFKRLTLTDIKIDVPRLAKKKVLKEAYSSNGAPLYCTSTLHNSTVTAKHFSRQGTGWVDINPDPREGSAWDLWSGPLGGASREGHAW